LLKGVFSVEAICSLVPILWSLTSGYVEFFDIMHNKWIRSLIIVLNKNCLKLKTPLTVLNGYFSIEVIHLLFAICQNQCHTISDWLSILGPNIVKKFGFFFIHDCLGSIWTCVPSLLHNWSKIKNISYSKPQMTPLLWGGV